MHRVSTCLRGGGNPCKIFSEIRGYQIKKGTPKIQNQVPQKRSGCSKWEDWVLTKGTLEMFQGKNQLNCATWIAASSPAVQNSVCTAALAAGEYGLCEAACYSRTLSVAGIHFCTLDWFDSNNVAAKLGF